MSEKRTDYVFEFGDEQIEISEWPYANDGKGHVDIELRGIDHATVFSQDRDDNECLIVEGECIYVIIRAKPEFLEVLYKELVKLRKWQRERSKQK